MSETVSDVCNIGSRERSKRRLLGFVALTAGIAAAFVLVVYDAPRWWRLVIFPLIWLGGLGLMQARDKVCISLAARGMRNMDAGEESIADAQLAAELRHKARSINRRALITAVLITILALVFPAK
ncbi:MAG: hypothetical protein JO360_15680 [Acidobacteria bacterium]|nr:hypothetical protein [Acidobacteriota bacterium]